MDDGRSPFGLGRWTRKAGTVQAFCPWRPLGTPLLFNWCWCVHPMRAGAADQRIRRPVSSAGRMKGMRHRWMRFEPYRPQAYFRTPEGIRRKDRRIGRIPFMRPATPRALTCSLPLRPLPFLPLPLYYLSSASPNTWRTSALHPCISSPAYPSSSEALSSESVSSLASLLLRPHAL